MNLACAILAGFSVSTKVVRNVNEKWTSRKKRQREQRSNKWNYSCHRQTFPLKLILQFFSLSSDKFINFHHPFAVSRSSSSLEKHNKNWFINRSTVKSFESFSPACVISISRSPFCVSWSAHKRWLIILPLSLSGDFNFLFFFLRQFATLHESPLFG